MHIQNLMLGKDYISFITDANFIKASIRAIKLKKQKYAKLEIGKNYIRFMDMKNRDISFSINVQYYMSSYDLPIIITIDINEFYKDLKYFDNFMHFIFLLDLEKEQSYYLINDPDIFEFEYIFINN